MFVCVEAHCVDLAIEVSSPGYIKYISPTLLSIKETIAEKKDNDKC